MGNKNKKQEQTRKRTMPTQMIEIIENTISQKSDMELRQEEEIKRLQRILRSKNSAEIKKMKSEAMKSLQSAGILDSDGKLSEIYKS